MAELAAGAVNSLLGVIRNEALLLGRVRGDVQFIKEEMESMNSFLAHLARTAPPGGEHDEQVRTWMNQVRLLAQDCNNCIDLYLYRGNPDIHRARGGLRRYLWWIPWFLQKMVAQHRAAIQLRELKERARDVGKRRLRYGVEVPGKAKAAAVTGQSPSEAATAIASSSAQTVTPTAAGGDAAEDEEEDDDQLVATSAHHSVRRRRRAAALFEPHTLDDYFKGRLVRWIRRLEEEVPSGSIASIAIVEPDTDEDALALACETLAVSATSFKQVLVDVPAVHHEFLPLRPKEILYYILRELELKKSQSQQQGTAQGPNDGYDWRAIRKRKWDIYFQKKELIGNMRENIQDMKGKLENISSDLRDLQLKGDQRQLQVDLEQMKDVDELNQKPLSVLLQLLLLQSGAAAAAPQQYQVRNKIMHRLAAWYGHIIAKTARKIKQHMEVDAKKETVKKPAEHMTAEEAAGAAKPRTAPILLYYTQYVRILRKVFPKISSDNSMPLQAQEQDTSTKTATMVEDQIKEMINKVTEMLQEVQGQEGKPDKTQAAGELDSQGQIPEALVKEIEQKIKEIKRGIKEQMKIKGIMDKIINHLSYDRKTLIILRIAEMMDGPRWEETRDALSLLGSRVAGALIITTTTSIQQAKEFCYPPQEPIHYSLVGFYHHTVIELTSQQKHEDKYNPQIFRDILEECEPHEFCMKIFAHALYANPKRSDEELQQLYHTLQDISQKSFVSIAMKMFKFSYNDLPKEYKSCLLYLAIFPQGHNIRRSTLIGRWVAEGLITKEDWPTSVRQAERCFDTLIDRWLLHFGHTGATGKIKSCMVGGPVHGFITKIARKQHIVDARLSLHLARHFSIFNDVQLRGSDRVDKFLHRLSESSQLSLLKVLDLEGCRCFGGKNQRYLKDICSKMLLLKYLSLRGTNITELPSEINNLHELEVLDIRQTKVRASTTKHVLLLKLKRLLAGHTDLNPSTTGTSRTEEFSSVRIPDKIEKMVNMEVLSNVKASQTGEELKDIRKLWQLRKLGVVIDDKNSHLRYLLQVISDLHECLQSLSITLGRTLREDTPSIEELPEDIRRRLKYTPEVLESLSISGTTQKGPLLPFLVQDSNQLAKVTLSYTWLNQEDMNVLAKLPKLLCVRLRHKAYTNSKLTFNKNEFANLKYFLVEGSNMSEISFEDEAAPDLEKIVLSYTDHLKSLAGVEGLPKLSEIELNNNKLLSLFDKVKQIAKVTLRGTFLRQGDLQILTKKPNMRYLALLDNSYVESQLTLNGEFPALNLLIVQGSHITKISFTSGSAPKLEKIVWTFTNMESLSSIDNLPRLKDLEFNGDFVPNEVKEAIRRHKNSPNLKHNKQEIQEQEKEDAQEGDDVSGFPFCCKNKF
ncbi:hypothetical protein ACP70R_032185 [Stipagrostis hirtigluma subsp. patula]